MLGTFIDAWGYSSEKDRISFLPSQNDEINMKHTHRMINDIEEIK